MNKKKVMLIILLLIIELIIIGINVDKRPAEVTNQVEVNNEIDENKKCKNLSCIYYNEKDFNKTIYSKEVYEGLENTVVGIIPHHLVAGDMIAGFMNEVSNDKVETVIMVGPSHDLDFKGITTSTRSWSTAFGVLETDVQDIEFLINSENISVENNWELMQRDQAISGLIPYVKKNFKNANVISILLGKSTKEEEIEILVQYLVNLTKNKECLVLGSIDFSHYLSEEEAKIKDKAMLEIIANKDYKKIKPLSSDYLDSPETLILLMKYIDTMKYNDLECIDRSSSIEKLAMPEDSEVFKDGITTYMIFKSDE